MNKHTTSMMAMLPQWMKMAKDPESVGANFLNAFGIELGEMENYIEEAWNNMYIGTADLQKIDYCYKIPLALRDVIDVNNTDFHVRLIISGERKDCTLASTLRVFFENEDNSYMIDTDEGFIYIRTYDSYMQENIFHPFDAIEIGDTIHYEYMLHQIWNVFDEFGMLLGIYRLPGERNEPFKNRILDVFKNPGGATKQGLTNGISRELGIDQSDVKLGSLTDKQYVQSSLINPDGTPNEKYLEYVNQINSNLGFAWDSMNWGDAYWRSIEENNMGFHYLPHIWDGFSTQWKDTEVQSGIGSGDDLLVSGPKKESSVRKFKAYVGLHGTEEQVEESNPEIRFKYKIVADGKIPNEEYELEQYRYTVMASEIIPIHYVLTAMRQFVYNTHISWDDRYGYTFKDSTNPGLEIITGEDVLHNEEEPHVQIHVEMKTSDRKVTPVLEELIVDWTDNSDNKHSYTLTTDEDFTQNTTMTQTTLADVEVGEGSVTLGKGSFSAVIDTEGSFLRGSSSVSVKVNKTGSVSLDLPTI
ncbi:hypothetical protein MOF23_06865 [Bacillus inaquosorum]|uniref:hypothetical protein n=1 Tax=Bacillus inaquosorum TaxID=483913 RepID=UPI00227E00A9|nr:hypothetical protein [Bacillus inaquosorum]MCY9308696.1 hypothetical protein [Bacillus inaquosorum]